MIESKQTKVGKNKYLFLSNNGFGEMARKCEMTLISAVESYKYMKRCLFLIQFNSFININEKFFEAATAIWLQL